MSLALASGFHFIHARVIMTLPPVNVVRNASLSSRMRALSGFCPIGLLPSPSTGLFRSLFEGMRHRVTYPLCRNCRSLFSISYVYL